MMDLMTPVEYLQAFKKLIPYANAIRINSIKEVIIDTCTMCVFSLGPIDKLPITWAITLPTTIKLPEYRNVGPDDVGKVAEFRSDGDGRWYQGTLLGILPPSFRSRFIFPEGDHYENSPPGRESTTTIVIYPFARILD
jgi:hypothetical protein